MLKTQNGSAIKRSALGVGKDIGGAIYLHRNYEGQIPNQPAFEHAKRTLAKNHPEHNYNVVKFDKEGKFTFFNSPDFDTAHEPTAGKYVTVKGKESKASETKSIWHHKWLWVKDDYSGFDVDQSFNRSKSWLQLPNINFSRIGSKKVWDEEYVPKIQ
jgi:hypothetical protein